MQVEADRTRSGRAALAVVVLVAGCYQTHEEVADRGVDLPVIADVERDVEVEVDELRDVDVADSGDAEESAWADVVRDADAEADVSADAELVDDGDGDQDIVDESGGDADTCPGTWLDPATGYLWENPASDAALELDDALGDCRAFSRCGHARGAWHLPTVNELRSLVRGCARTAEGGACAVTDLCADVSCWSTVCIGCVLREGPGGGGCYWEPGVEDEASCGWWYWSSSAVAGAPSEAWTIYFDHALVEHRDATFRGWVRCVHSGP
ncbi:MAG: DUF1566 domain-containing protein [Deltaproteobacteria bacterium]|nr:DUF1566 domain-containing protein [Deltaproteobacteria bacterium]